MRPFLNGVAEHDTVGTEECSLDFFIRDRPFVFFLVVVGKRLLTNS